MINFITGRCGTGKSRMVSDSIVREINSGSRDVVLIVPEQQTVVWETKMASRLPTSANFRLEITNFTRLANSVFREYGGLAESVVDDGTRALLIWRAMISVWDQLRVYSSGRNESEISREDKNIPHLLAAVDELKNSGISPSDAEKALDSLMRERDSDSAETEGGLSSRLSDAVLVYSAYQSFLHEEYIDRGDLLDNLASALAEYPYFKGKSVYIDSFFSLTRAEERILSHIFRQADEVTVTFACPADGEQRTKIRTDPDQLSMFGESEEKSGCVSADITFAEIEKFRRTALSIAAKWGKSVRKISLDKNYRHAVSVELAAVESRLFDYTADLPEKKNCRHDISIITCADVYDEAEACAALIDRLIRQGYRYSDIAVVARDMKTREGIVDRILRRHGIRCFMSESGDAASLPAVRLVTSALAVAANGWQRKDIIALAKTGMTAVGREISTLQSESADESIEDLEGDPEGNPIEIEQAEKSSVNTAFEGDIFEIYTETWNIRGRKAYTSGPWSMNPAGYKTERSEESEAMLLAANRAREKLIEPLERFLSVFDSGEATVREIAERIVYYAEECRIEDALQSAAQSYRELGMAGEAEKVLVSWSKVCDILDCMVKNLGDAKISAGRFSGLFSRVAAATDVGSIPTGIDEVILGSSSGIRTDSVKCVIMLGAVDGEFPGTVNDSGAFFSERDKIALEAVGLNISSPDLNTRAARELFMFYRTAASASEKLFVLVPSSDEALLSEGASRIRAITDAVRGSSCLVRFADMPISDTVYTKSTAEYLLSRRPDAAERALLRAVSDGIESAEQCAALAERDITGDRAPEERIEHAQVMLIPGTDEALRAPRLNLSQSKIETFVQCPFSFWSRYEMKIRPTPKAEITPPDIGTFMHSVLERFFRRVPAQSLPLSRSESEKIADEIIEEYIKALAASGLGRTEAHLADGRLEYLFLRLRRHVMIFIDAIMRELEQSGFRPMAFELPIGLPSPDGKQVDAMTIPTDFGIDVVLRGIADRADIYTADDGRKYIRIVDYKTGSKLFSLDEVRRGLHVQMLIYLFSLKHYGDKTGTPLHPAGALYFQAKPSSISEPKEPSPDEAAQLAVDRIERRGVLLSDEEIHRAMDSRLEGKFINVKTSRDGDIKSSSKYTALMSAQELGALEGDLCRVIGKIASRMLSGEADAAPMKIGGKNPCDWCDSRMICRHIEE